MISLFSVKLRRSTYNTKKKKSLNDYGRQDSSSNYKSVASSRNTFNT